MTDSLPLFLILCLSLGTLLPLFACKLSRKSVALISGIAPLTALIFLLLGSNRVFSGVVLQKTISWLPSVGISFSFMLDGLGYLFALLILGIGLLVILYSYYYISESFSLVRFYFYLLFFMTAMLGIVVSKNVIMLWSFWELTSVGSFLLISFWLHRAEARNAAIMAWVITGLGGICLLASLLLLGSVTGSYEITEILTKKSVIQESSFYPAILFLALIAAFTKSAQFPFHFWLPKAMAAPTPVSAYLHSATMVKAGIFFLARFYPVLASTSLWFFSVSLTGLVTFLLGAVLALFKDDLKGLLAYSTISHLGLIVLLLGFGTPFSCVAAVFHIINHAIFKASLFMAAGIIDHETGSRDMRKINGLWHYMPITATLAITSASSMAGVPLLNGFLSKEMFFGEVLQISLFGEGLYLMPILALIAATLAVAYSSRFIHDVFFNGEPHDLPKIPKEPTGYIRLPVEALVLLCILVGLFPNWMIGDLLRTASRAVLQGPLPPFTLTVWHGLNMPLIMSFVALVAGILLYMNRQYLVRIYEKFPKVDAMREFQYIIRFCQKASRRFLSLIENGSLQRYMFLLFFTVASFSLYAMKDLFMKGGLPTIALDPVTATGAYILILASFATVFFYQNELLSIISLSIVGLIVSIAFIRFSAPDLSLTQLSVEVVTMVLLMLALFFLSGKREKHSTKWQRRRDILLATITGAVFGILSYAMLTNSFSSISDFYLEAAKTKAGGANAVNVILVDFRGFDTLGEITVLGICAIGIYTLLTGFHIPMPISHYQGRSWSSDRHAILVSVISQILLPIGVLVSLYIFFRGHNLPGGGFIAGLITSIAVILQYIAHGVDWVQSRMRLHYFRVCAVGLFISFSTGAGALVFGYPFLTSWYTHLTIKYLGTVEIATAMFFDLGVYVTVVGATLLMLATLGQATTGHNSEGRVCNL